MGRKIEIGGVPVTVVDEDEAENADCVVCMPADYPAPPQFRDNVITTCSMCGVAIQHRPTVPKKPPKVCFDCATKLAETANEAPAAGGPTTQ